MICVLGEAKGIRDLSWVLAEEHSHNRMAISPCRSRVSLSSLMTVQESKRVGETPEREVQTSLAASVWKPLNRA